MGDGYESLAGLSAGVPQPAPFAPPPPPPKNDTIVKEPLREDDSINLASDNPEPNKPKTKRELKKSTTMSKSTEMSAPMSSTDEKQLAKKKKKGKKNKEQSFSTTCLGVLLFFAIVHFLFYVAMLVIIFLHMFEILDVVPHLKPHMRTTYEYAKNNYAFWN